MAMRKCDFCQEERQCKDYGEAGWLCERCQYILFETCKEVVRLDAAIDYYEKHWINHRRYYWAIQIILISLTALIPIFNIDQATSPNLHTVVTGLGSAAVGVTALNQLLKFQDSWPLLKSTWAQLDRERKLYDGKFGHYSSENEEENCKRLVETVEKIIYNQRQGYAEIHQPPPRKEN